MTAVSAPYPPLHFVATVLIATLTACAAPPSGPPPSVSSDEWPAYAGSAGARFSPRDEITPANVSRLAVAWTYHTGELGQNARDGHKLTFEATPIHFDGRLYLSTAYGHVIALDPVTANGAVALRCRRRPRRPLQRSDVARRVGMARFTRRR